ncbi:hypothetical protein CHGG_05405 [Chaetomium globosum CBS 148.51]|uniref:Uncharacterized protein n=1 Tax=Chaetomium globosum (strain ATCC 6205 / CBS 148.51 / DSM 1962 / NBRC 6347 / NRRL 1970) TaxID=306901 RepID=Q2H7G0_CHAGB|nr:uncharacterized protein CHGG_05405 [Chaetomium globosum CBS 148.51]EAQ88786.1 hypothetical protein CHGG_05405 [Chaetomium globosum CBS 148.51]
MWDSPDVGRPSNGQVISQPDGFKFTDADSRYGDDYRSRLTPAKQAEPPLGILAALEGKCFRGPGINMIFRPNNGPPPGTDFPNPVNPPPPDGTSDNALEINLYEETLSFSKGVGRVPNRGSQKQPDIDLNAIMYLQSINDVTNPDTGDADGTPVSIHIENGMFMHVPSSDVNPKIGTTIGRCGTIPHGVAIHLQGFAPSSPSTHKAGPPHIPSINTTPFQTNSPSTQVTFPSLMAANQDTPRIPQDLTNFIQQGTITQEILNDPTTILRNANKTRNILSTSTLQMSSTPTAGIQTGGGVIGSAFLNGDATPSPTSRPNAKPLSVDFTLWIETVEYAIPIPASNPTPAYGPLEVLHQAIRFVVHPPRRVREPMVLRIRTVELQYLQVVLLEFDGLSWPHPSCATLRPECVVVPREHDGWGQRGVGCEV